MQKAAMERILSIKISALILLELRHMPTELFPPRLQHHRGAKHHPPTQKNVRMVHGMLESYLEDMHLLVQMNLVVCGSLKPESIEWWKVMNEFLLGLEGGALNIVDQSSVRFPEHSNGIMVGVLPPRMSGLVESGCFA